MKKIFVLICSIAIISIAQSQVQKIEVQASGLTCSMCSNAINKSLKALLFAEAVETDLNKNIFSITIKKGLNPDFDLVKQKVEDAGFSVASLWIIGQFNQLAIKNDEHVAADGFVFHFMNVKTQVLAGVQKLKLLDKNFIPGKEYKKMSATTHMACYASGYMQSCCTLSGNGSGKQRIYHVTI